jgi:hypothetical protein
MATETTALPDFLSTLNAATGSKSPTRPKPETVVQALLEAEKVTKQQRLTFPPEQLVGDWRLWFVTGTRKLRQRGGIRLGQGFYLPPLGAAQISFQSTITEDGREQIMIGNQVQLGQLRLTLTGPARYLGKKNLMAFDFTQIQVSLGSWTMYQGSMRGGKAQAESFDQQSIAKLPFFAFFGVTDRYIAARGRGGGLALWVKANAAAD